MLDADVRSITSRPCRLLALWPSLRNDSTYSQTVHMIRLNDSSACFPESDFLKRESVGRDAAADEHLACFRWRYRHIWAVCLCVCVFIPPLPECPAVLCLQVETVWFAANDVAARWCERPGRGAAPQTPGKKTHKTQVRVRETAISQTPLQMLGF